MVNHPNRSKRFVDELMAVYEGPFAVSRGCNLCKFVDTRRKVRGAGRGSGFREGNQQRGRLIQHIKAEHPEAYAEALEAHRARAAAMKTERERNAGLTVGQILQRDSGEG